jgi:hypothetical protein
MALPFDYAFEPAQDSDWSRLDNLLSELCVWLSKHPRLCCALVCAVCLMPTFLENPR